MTRLLLVVMTAALLGAWAGAEGVQVTVRGGVLRGATRDAGQGRLIYSFKGVPYAKPPVGALRFKDPEPAEAWEGARECFEPPMCPQIDYKDIFSGKEMKVIGEEDCLYLHVYTPQLCGSELLPVMVFLHGGAFFLGYPDHAGGSPMPLLTKDVVLVTPQYRLGTLGFLYSGDTVIPGNMGMKDLTLALRWVQENIANFGGDPQRVTIFGESAGGAAVHYLMLTPKAAGLFHRAIMQSGNSLGPWALQTSDPRGVAASVGRQVGCEGVEVGGRLDSEALLTCLQNKPVDDIVLAMSDEKEAWNNSPLRMVPRVDGDYLPAHPAQLLREGRYNQVDVISGVNQHEGVFYALGVTNTPLGEQLLANFSRFGPLSLGTQEEERAYYLTQRIYYHYLQGANITFDESTLEQTVELFGDVMFALPHDITSLFHARDAAYGKGVYMYQLEHRGNYTFLELFTNQTSAEYVSHGDDLLYLFDDVFSTQPLQRPDDLFLREVMVELWTTFAATGNPTPDLTLGFTWEPITPANLQYLSLRPNLKMKPDTRAENRAFFTSLPTLQNKLLFPEKFANLRGAKTSKKTEKEEHHCHL